MRNAGPLRAVSERRRRLRARMVTRRASRLSFLVEGVELDRLAQFACPQAQSVMTELFVALDQVLVLLRTQPDFGRFF